MTSIDDMRDDPEAPEPDDGAVIDGTLAAHDDERFVEAKRPALAARLRFAAVVVLVLLLHAALIAAFLWRDQHDRTQVAQITETPIEIVQEPPPEPVKPPPPPPKTPPPPPKPKEDLSPALSAPRAPNEEKVETKKLQDKTSAPKAPTPPAEGQTLPKPVAAPPKDEAPPAPTKEDEAAKEEDKSKPDAEALDKAKPKVAKQSKTKEAKATPKRKEPTKNLFASLSGTSLSPDISFARPTPKARVYGGTEDVRWMSEVEGMLEDKVGKLPRTSHWQSGGHVVIFFHVDTSGRVISRDIYVKSGYPDIDAMALRALAAAAPFPPPPPGIEHGLIWSTVFDGQLPTVHVGKR